MSKYVSLSSLRENQHFLQSPLHLPPFPFKLQSHNRIQFLSQISSLSLSLSLSYIHTRTQFLFVFSSFACNSVLEIENDGGGSRHRSERNRRAWGGETVTASRASSIYCFYQSRLHRSPTSNCISIKFILSFSIFLWIVFQLILLFFFSFC